MYDGNYGPIPETHEEVKDGWFCWKRATIGAAIITAVAIATVKTEVMHTLSGDLALSFGVWLGVLVLAASWRGTVVKTERQEGEVMLRTTYERSYIDPFWVFVIAVIVSFAYWQLN